ncbi:hypothetical protein AN641_03925 [Candidatus Epulonipiscioides gigas]|nr:hypothetical protein AN641_03925 [Epulopiscium sp. SCG-C07WGA-EpuloA2]
MANVTVQDFEDGNVTILLKCDYGVLSTDKNKSNTDFDGSLDGYRTFTVILDNTDEKEDDKIKKNLEGD